MVYDFNQQKPFGERIVFALALDKDKMTERIVIGTEWQVHSAFHYNEADCFYDSTRPLGQFLIDFVADTDSSWAQCQAKLEEIRKQVFVLRQNPVQEKNFLEEQYKTENPVALYAALRIWDEYLLSYTKNHNYDIFQHRVSVLTRPFSHYLKKKPWETKSSELTSNFIFSEDAVANLWYPSRKRPVECLVVFDSFMSVLLYYLKRIEEWNYSFRPCRICGNMFLAASKHYDLCSAACRKEQKRINKREYDERMAGKSYQALYDSACDRWYNKLRKVRKEKAANPKQVAALKKSYKEFRVEALPIKKEVAKGKKPLTDLTGCIQKHYQILDALL